MMNKVRLTIGDWSGDGHEQSESFVYEVNKSVEEIRQAYKDSCKLTGVQFNHNQNYSGLPEHNKYRTDLHVCTEYESGSMSIAAYKKLKSFGLDAYNYSIEEVEEEEECVFDADNFAELIMEFIKLSLPDLTYEEAPFKKSELKTMPAINGWWNPDLNVQFGYGLFD